MTIYINGYFATWCPHCKEFKSTWKQLQEKLPNIKFNTYLDGKDNDIISQRNISGFPTIQLEYNGKLIELERSNDLNKMIKIINNNIKDINSKKNYTTDLETFKNMSSNEQFDVFNNILTQNDINLIGGNNITEYNNSYLESPEQFYKEKYMKYKMKYLELKNSLNKK